MPAKACPKPDGATEDRLLGGRVVLRQPADGYRAAIDPVLLAAAVPARPGERVLDLGCGVGAAALCLLARVPDGLAVGLEVQPRLAALARANAAANRVADRFAVLEGDLAAPPAELAGERFDHVMANPPYLTARGFAAPPDRAKALANQEAGADLAAWLHAAHALLRPKGRLTLIHRADRLDAIGALLRPRFGAVEIVPLWPRTGRPARRVIIRARRDARGPTVLAPGLALHGPDGRFTAAAEAILRHAAPLE